MPHVVIEPFRIKVVEPIHFTTARERVRLLKEAHYNLFDLRAADVIVDLMNEAASAAMSAEQWAALIRADEFCGGLSHERLRDVMDELMGLPFVFATNQGRTAERLLFAAMRLRGRLVASNGLYDTTRANLDVLGAIGLDVPHAGSSASEPESVSGGIDLFALDDLFIERGSELAAVILTLTNGMAGGRAVSLANMRSVASWCRKRGVPLVIDASRFAENAYRVEHEEPAEHGRSLHDIARQTFDLCDAFTMSARKDALAHAGGLIGVRDPECADRIAVDPLRANGPCSFSGVSARDLDAIARGLHEALDAGYLRHRFAIAELLAASFTRAGWKLITPTAAHAIYIDVTATMPERAPNDLMAQSVADAFYLAGGVRVRAMANALGSLRRTLQLVRVALPHRVYTDRQLAYVADIANEVARVRKQLPAMRIAPDSPSLRHWTAHMEPTAPFVEFTD